MGASRFLTKSRFKVGCECPTKLYYLDDKSYGNNNIENSFLESLAEGGFQVGELAKLYHPGGTEIETIDKDLAAKQTTDLLKLPNAIIYEASLKFENLFIKADILIKNGNNVELIEVKAKSFDPGEENPFYNKTALKSGVRQINGEWEPYILDVAFQTSVFKKAFPSLSVKSHLMLANKSAAATVDGLNQAFFLSKDKGGKTKVVVRQGLASEQLGEPILIKVDVNQEVATAWNMTFENGLSFPQMVDLLSNACKDRTFISPVIGGQCKSCEFRIGDDTKALGLKSGFENCWSKATELKSNDLKKPLVFDIWNFRKSAKLLEQGKFLMESVSEEDVSPQSKKGEPGMSSSQRQWLQVSKAIAKDSTPYMDFKGLQDEMKAWRYPLHFIDFETTMVAIPFNKGRRPYEQMAFQFSHHLVESDGKITHKTEYINRKRGAFPNFEFVRELKSAIGNDNGTIFRYAAHENTVLCQIRNQLITSKENISDQNELIAFIESITASTEKSDSDWEGPRNMVDLCDLVKRYVFHPRTNGSNSIKKVLPAILNDSTFLRDRYSKPIYGTSVMPSRNFTNWAWIQTKENEIVDPYKLLPPIFDDLDLETMDSLITDGSIADGGAAMTAYARMQFTEMSEAECDRVAKALLKYCELDTFAMVLIFEHWKNELEKRSKNAA